MNVPSVIRPMSTSCNEKDVAFIRAAEKGHDDTLTSLFSSGTISLDLLNEALLYGAYGGHMKVVQFALTHGANVHHRNEAALRFAASKQNRELVQFLLFKGANRHDALCISALAGNLLSVRFLYENACDLRDLGLMHSVLQLAAENGHLDIVQYLFANGADQINIPLRICY